MYGAYQNKAVIEDGWMIVLLGLHLDFKFNPFIHYSS